MNLILSISGTELVFDQIGIGDELIDSDPKSDQNQNVKILSQ